MRTREIETATLPLADELLGCELVREYAIELGLLSSKALAIKRVRIALLLERMEADLREKIHPRS